MILLPGDGEKAYIQGSSFDIGIPDDQLGQNFTNETYDPPSIKGPFQFFDGFFCHFWFLATPGHKTSTLVRII